MEATASGDGFVGSESGSGCNVGVGVCGDGSGDVSGRICRLKGGVGIIGVLGGALNIADRSMGLG